MEINIILLFGLIVFITHFLEGITGFGCTVLAMPFAITLVGLSVAKPTLTIIAFLLCLYIVVISWKKISWDDYFTIIFYMVIGLPIGILCFNYLPESLLKNILAFFMIIVSIRGLYKTFYPNKNKLNTKSYILKFILFLAGIIHGAFTTGGPLVIIYATEKLKNKNTFRATLCMVNSKCNNNYTTNLF